MLHSLRPVVPHALFQAEARAQLFSLYPNPARSLRPWADDLRLVWHADLDFADATLRARYSLVGPPVIYDPKALLRSLLLCHRRGYRSLTPWAAQLRREPALAILCGFQPDRTPVAGLFYAFLARLYPEVCARRVHGIVRRHRRVPKPRHGQKLPAGRGKLARCAAWLQRHLAELPAPNPEDLWDEVLTGSVASSVRQGILPADAPLAAAADGSC